MRPSTPAHRPWSWGLPTWDVTATTPSFFGFHFNNAYLCVCFSFSLLEQIQIARYVTFYTGGLLEHAILWYSQYVECAVIWGRWQIQMEFCRVLHVNKGSAYGIGPTINIHIPIPLVVLLPLVGGEGGGPMPGCVSTDTDIADMSRQPCTLQHSRAIKWPWTHWHSPRTLFILTSPSRAFSGQVPSHGPGRATNKDTSSPP